jgi:hypothetical protein
LLGLLAWICFFTPSLTWVPVESWLICKLLTLGALLAFAPDILDFFIVLLASLLGLSPWRFAALGMFYNPSSDDLIFFSRRDMRSGFDKVRITYPRPKDQSISIFLLLLLETSCFHILPLLLLRSPWLPDFAFLGYPCCGIISSVCLFCRLLVNVLFCYCMHLLHQRIC